MSFWIPLKSLLAPSFLRLRGCRDQRYHDMDVTQNPAFFDWLKRQVDLGIRTLVIGGCTTTSCVRVSSQQIISQLADENLTDKVRVVVDLTLCGARSDNFERTAERDPVLVRAYGREFCVGKSAVELAVFQMRQSGVQVLDSDSGGWQW